MSSTLSSKAGSFVKRSDLQLSPTAIVKSFSSLKSLMYSLGKFVWEAFDLRKAQMASSVALVALGPEETLTTTDMTPLY